MDNPRVVKQANPASWVTRRSAPGGQGIAARPGAPPLRREQWTERAGHWLPPGAWQDCAGEPDFERRRADRGRVDIGGERVDCAVVWINEALQVGVEVLRAIGPCSTSPR